MPFNENAALPRDGHELTSIGGSAGIWWCIRCGALSFDEDRGHWEAPGQSGRSHSSVDAPPCVISTDAGAANPAGDAQLMLRALTHGWHCEPVRLASLHDGEAWHWSRSGPLGGESWSVPGEWEAGPTIDVALRRLLMTTTG
jgi:hypothetical protein